jgi:hypothetical protein
MSLELVGMEQHIQYLAHRFIMVVVEVVGVLVELELVVLAAAETDCSQVRQIRVVVLVAIHQVPEDQDLLSSDIYQ